MAFITIPTSWYDVGKALKQQLFSRFNNNLEYLNDRVDSLALGASSVIVFNDVVLNASTATTLTGLTYFYAPAGFTVTTVQVEIFEKGDITSGTLSIDIKKGATLGSTFTTILTSQASIDFATAVDYATDTGVLDAAEQDVAQGEYLRLDVTSLPTIPLGKFRVLVYGSVA
jgi:hypothetical protein